MSNELLAHTTSGQTLYAILFNATGQVWNGSAFVAPANANWATYDIAMIEASTTGIYRATMPAVAAEAYSWLVYKQTGASPTVGDTVIGSGTIRWTGTAEEAVPAAVNVTTWQGEEPADLDDDGNVPVAGSGGGATAQDVWEYAIRTLTQPLPTQEQQETEQGIRIVRALTFQHTWSGVALPPNWSKLIWTLKDVKFASSADDSKAIAQVALSNPASEADGLVRLLNAKTINKQFGTLVFDESQGTISLEINDDATAVFSVMKAAKYDLKVLKADGRSERLLIGDAIISPTVTLEAQELEEDEPE